MMKMNYPRQVLLAGVSALVGLSLGGCSQQPETTNVTQSNQMSTAQTTLETVAPASTNTTTDPGTAPPALPETSMPVSTNVLPTAAPLPVTP